MKIDSALHNVNHLFLDSAPVVYYVERNPTYEARVDDIFDRITAGTPQAVTTPITLVGAIRQGLTQTQQNFTDLIVSGANVTFVIPDAAVGQRAAELRAQYNLGLLDTFQLAVALAARCDAFLTNDRAILRVREIPILVLDDLEL